MDYVRKLLALPEPGYDPSGKTYGELRVDAFLRKRQSPLWRFIHWCQALDSLIPRALRRLRDRIWAATLGRYLYVKVDRHGTEALTMKFVSSQTKIPIPRVWFTAKWWGQRYTVMTRIRGVDLQQVWGDLSEETKLHVARQLRECVSQLRSIPAPSGTAICSINGGPVQSSRLHEWDPVSGPFRDEDHLNLQLRHLKPLHTLPPIVQKVQKKHHALVFTHNDFFPRNIMIDKVTGRVLAIIDWESAGWFPEHWEYCISRNWGRWRPQREWMEKYVDMIVPVYREEAEADRVLMYECGFPCMVPGEQAP